jgi:putative FmdB family regulatory protein
MPIFEYDCEKCGHDFELLVFDREAPINCPACGSGKVEKKLSVFAHKSEDKFVPSSGGSSCSGCSASSCSGCSGG